MRQFYKSFKIRSTLWSELSWSHYKLLIRVESLPARRFYGQEAAEWGDAVVGRLAEYIRSNHPEFKGFTRRGLYRMKQFYEIYRQEKIVSAVLTQTSWTNHLLILHKRDAVHGETLTRVNRRIPPDGVPFVGLTTKDA